ncbi:SHC SH2 domain-binding protein 1 homolog A-like isoform X2 [Ornithodoros turicata]|uniref:SHC SH2 domain-binding protein 1 homolog A-like isoform X2 n=1 Tax=Ornithodoros turicata TaxID=34597 RepID=UPI00313A0C8F
MFLVFLLCFSFVLNVSRTSLDADIKLISLLSESCRSVEGVNRLLESNCIPVPLVELYPLFEDGPHNDYKTTAVAIEYARFFYNHVWRPWDDPEDDDEVFSTKLSSRIKLFMDIKHSLVPSEVEARANMVLREGWEIRERLDELQADMSLSDSESELNEEDVAQALHFNMRLEELSREMELLENPLLRNLLVRNDFLRRSPQLEGARKHDGRVVHMVAETFTFSKLLLSKVDPEACLEFHHALGSALSCASSGDTVLIFPGIHTCIGLPWLDRDISIEGLGSPGETILTPIDAGDIFMNCSSSTLSISNITIRSSRHVQYIIVLHSGSLGLRNCHIEGSTADTCLKVLKNAELVVENCEINSAMTHGISVRAGGILKTTCSTISNCKKSGIMVEHQPGLQPNTIELSQTVVEKCGAFGIQVENVLLNSNTNMEIMKEGGFGDISRLSFLGISTKDSTFKENTMGPFSILYAPS